ncbi:MAG: polyphosphate polymerase domain-containing protein [Bacteroidia bacterium]
MITAEIKTALSALEPITLEEMDRVKLMDRNDFKFLINAQQLADFLHEVKDDYRSLEVSGTRMSRYETLYYDTPDFGLYRKHHNGRTARHKIRMRRYVESDLHFFEIKYKNNKGRTVKSRVKKKSGDPEISGSSLELLLKHTGLNAADIEPKLWVNYTRITLVNKVEEERLTIDLDLEVKAGDDVIHYNDLVIIEAKQGKYTETPFIKQLKEHRVKEGGMSKYCIAVANLVGDVKKNNFKEGIRKINKINKS